MGKLVSLGWTFLLKKRCSLDCGVKSNQRGRDRGQAWSNGVITKPVKKLKGHSGYVKDGTDTY